MLALHILALLGNECTAQGMTGAGKAGKKTMRIPIDAHAAMGAERGTFRVGEALVEGQPGRLAIARDRHGLLGLQIPGMIQIEIGNRARHGTLIGEPRAVIARRVARNGAGFGHGALDCCRAQIGSAGRTLALSEIDRDGHAPIPVVLDGIDVAESHGD